VRHIVGMGKMRNANKIVVRKHEGKGPLLMLRYRQKYNIKWILRKQNVDWIHLPQGPMAGSSEQDSLKGRGYHLLKNDSAPRS